MTARLVAWGGYDSRKPRVRLLLAALRRHQALAEEIGIPVWRGLDEKSLPTRGRLLRAGARLIGGLPRALYRLLRSPRDAAILLPYLGTPEVFLAAIVARIQGRAVVLDAFLPLHDTIVRDRRLVQEHGWIARLVLWCERAGHRLADSVLVDTDQHGDFFANEFGLPRDKYITAMVGAEPLFDPALVDDPLEDLLGPPDGRPIVLFYGLLIPLHGIATILEAAQLACGSGVRWVFVGKGQLEPLVHEMLADPRSRDVAYLPWVDYRRLPALIARADLCLGVFGSSGKAERVIPNKVFQALAMGRPIVTRSSPAIDALARSYPNTIVTVPAADPARLAAVVGDICGGRRKLRSLPRAALTELMPDAGVRKLLERLGER